ncbi:hypothetical protein COW36_12750 [bacterium (Candidatus Blackallbacteria) CG17_big_fil_post_rev_8_21_14_2_50_48_46]|uniref:Uncharacterized protein n=1 Tax=bacterium (Candidatus Blackallbacteria) CG17_big_fil_post_rev_8_21_14_2_50_48_46 TaxID=2014261 RepID=A0A2M7G438_9BACT|nr:MAG: hypothetical protein COW64_02515 [bacterium (Candidatus Blackallbacteria) CG18_big_fil_WC_8_21_14_2_50_49_26]PIW16630.1 MAG: hypothetical protein COW36_12750 [bacterium (Candidatus Blackallbacteria) CG17_big_fil_post_rev_8_21_14_2_50_48_46]PIW46137.1 MAG: hypothetical protein COW20_18010 [bacterium (Candidatus Blackallbacteria) CG13_big_fil_rev_8_21_14_2_50_49_14]
MTVQMLHNTSLELDHHYDQLEAAIAGLVASYQQAPTIKASLDPADLLKLSKDQQFLKKSCDSFQTALDALDTDKTHETAQLHLNLKPLQLRLALLDEALRVSEIFKSLDTRIKAEIAEVKEASIALSKQILPYHLPKFEAGLEMFMDRCDQVADLLDTLEQQGHEITVFMPDYEMWLFLVEQFGEILDERIEILKPQALTP